MGWLTRNLRDSETGRISGKEVWLRLRSAAAVLLSVGVLVAGVSLVSDRVQTAWLQFRTAEDYIGEGVAPVEVTIAKGTTLSAIADLLVEHDVIKTAKSFDREAAANADAKKIQAGRYRLKTQIPAKLALSMLLDPANIIRVRMTLTEGQRLSVQVQQMAKATQIPEKEFNKALKDWKKLGLPKWAKNSAEGFLFPETYELPADPTAESVIKLATAQFNQVVKGLDFQAAAKRNDVNAYQALVIASIIEREVRRDEDRPKVARVIYNRLAEGMKLEMDSTIHYIVNESGKVFTSAEQRTIDSPYNTYLKKGLPPGPISSPGRKSMEAAVNPAEGDWLFFVAVNLDTGETEFNETLAGHNASRQKLNEWCRASDENRKKC